MKEETPGHSRDDSARGDYRHASDVHVAGCRRDRRCECGGPYSCL